MFGSHSKAAVAQHYTTVHDAAEGDCEAAGEGGTLGWDLQGGGRRVCATGSGRWLCGKSEMTWLLLVEIGGEEVSSGNYRVTTALLWLSMVLLGSIMIPV